jgi:hypothetical protein
VSGFVLCNLSTAWSYSDNCSLCRFGKRGYDKNTVCEYHFVVKKVAFVTFEKIHLDKPHGRLTNVNDCKKAAHAHGKHRDYIEMNVKFDSGYSHVFCGQPNRKIYRKIRDKDLPKKQGQQEKELVITFWSDASQTGEGFLGYFISRTEPVAVKRQ